jgi:DegV family protein with EDD domain
MTDLQIVTDSTASLPKSLVDQYSIEVAPQIIIWDGEVLKDEIDITVDQFYERLVRSSQLPTTSQVTVASFLEIFEPAVKRGATILAILISDQLSGTIHSAEQAKEEFPKARIEIFNSKTAAMALGFQVLAAARAAESGMPLEEILENLKDWRENSGVIFVVDTLEYLHKGGRIGGAARLLGSALSLKPLLSVVDGRIEAIERVRTKKKATERLLDLIGEKVEGKSPIRLSALHAYSPEEVKALRAESESRFDIQEYIPSEVGPVIGTHVGPGTLGIAYIAGV